MEHDFSKPVNDLASDVPEQFRPLYTEKEGGGFELKDTPEVKGATEAIVGLNRSLKASRAEAKDHKSKAVDLAPLSEFGSSPDEIKATVAAKIDGLEGQVKGGKEAKMNIEKIKGDLASGHKKDIEAKDATIKALTKQLHTHLVDSKISTALEGKVVDVDLARPHVKDRVRVATEDGEIKVFVVDEAGDRRYSGTSGGVMTINELVKEMGSSKKFAPLFKSETKRGSGQKPGTTTSPGPGKRADGGTPISKIAQGLEQRGI